MKKQGKTNNRSEKIDYILSQLEGVKKVGKDRWSALCPAHDDTHPSLSIKATADKLLLHCQGGCAIEKVLESIDRTFGDLFFDCFKPNSKLMEDAERDAQLRKEAEQAFEDGDKVPPKPARVTKITTTYHNYPNKLNQLSDRVKRIDYPDKPKEIRVEVLTEKGWVPSKGRGIIPHVYYAPSVYRHQHRHRSASAPLFIVEGELEADLLIEWDLYATTNQGGSGKWNDSHSQQIVEGGWEHIRILPDNDADGKGLKHAQQVAQSLSKHGIKDVRIVILPNLPLYGGDVIDYAKQDGTKEQLLRIAKATKPETLTKKAVRSGDDHAQVRKIQTAEGMLDVSNSEGFAVFLEGKYRHCYSLKRWSYYDGKRFDFSKDEQGQIVEAAKEYSHRLFQKVAECTSPIQRDQIYARAKRASAKTGLQAMVELAQSDPLVKVRADALDTDIYLFNCLSGTLDLRTGTLRPHNPNNLITKLAPVEYPAEIGHKAAPIANSLYRIRTWLRCLKEWMCGNQDNIDYLQRVGGYFLTGDTRSRAFLTNYGGGRNGKSTFIETIGGLMGDYADVAPRLLLEITKMEQHPTELMDLKGVRLITA